MQPEIQHSTAITMPEVRRPPNGRRAGPGPGIARRVPGRAGKWHHDTVTAITVAQAWPVLLVTHWYSLMLAGAWLPVVVV